MLDHGGYGGGVAAQYESRAIAHSRASMGDVEPLIDAIEDVHATGFEEWKRGVEVAAAELFERGGRAHVQIVAGLAPRRIDDSEGALRVSGDIGSATSVELSIERGCAGRLRPSDRSRMRHLAYHLENRACFHLGRSGAPLSMADVSPRLWLDLVSGRASLVRDRDGYRVVTAPPSWVRHRAFNATQAHIVTLATRGNLYKSIAHELGLSSAAVSHALAIAAAKIGLRRPLELLRLAHGLTDHEDEAARESSLTDAEREVVELVLAGMSNDAIARERNRSLRTVANQVSSVLRKLRCASRYQLAASRGLVEKRAG